MVSLIKKKNLLTPTLARMFSRELVREVRALFLRISSLKRLPLAEESAPDELFAAFCQVKITEYDKSGCRFRKPVPLLRCFIRNSELEYSSKAHKPRIMECLWCWLYHLTDNV